MSVFDFSQFPILLTSRLRLRQMTHHDAAVMMTLFGDPEMLRFSNNTPTDTLEKAIHLIDFLEGSYQQQDGINWGITLPDSDTLIGMCGAYGWDRVNRRADIGYHIHPSQWGKGYATEAARAIITWCFANFDLHRIQADCTDGNIGSERVLLKCGFSLEGIWRESCWEHGRFVNIRQFGLLRGEFKLDSAR